MFQILFPGKILVKFFFLHTGSGCNIRHLGVGITLFLKQIPGCLHQHLPDILLLAALSSQKKAVAKRVCLVQDPLIQTGDPGTAGDLGNDTDAAGDLHLLHGHAPEQGTGNALIDKLFLQSDLSLGIEGGQLGTGAGTARGTVCLCVTKDDAVFHIGLRVIGMGVKLHQIHGGNIQIGMFDLHGPIDLLPDLHAKGCDLLDIFDLQRQTDLFRIYQGKEGTAEGNVIVDGSLSGDFQLQISFI